MAIEDQPLTPEEQEELAQLRAMEQNETQLAGELSNEEKIELEELRELERAEKAGALPSEVESFGRGVAQDLTFGFSDEMVGGLKAAKDAFVSGDFSEEAFKSNYIKGRDEEREKNRLAEIANPKSYFAGELSSFAVTGLAGATYKLGGKALTKLAGKQMTKRAMTGTTLAKLAPAAKNLVTAGSKYKASVADDVLEASTGAVKAMMMSGALNGAGYSQGDLISMSDNDAANIAEFGFDALTGMAIGGALGKTGQKLMGTKIAQESIEWTRKVSANAQGKAKELLQATLKGDPGGLKLTGNVLLDNFNTNKAGIDMTSKLASETKDKFVSKFSRTYNNFISDNLRSTGRRIDEIYDDIADLADPADAIDLQKIVTDTFKDLKSGANTPDVKQSIEKLEFQLKGGLDDLRAKNGVDLGAANPRDVNDYLKMLRSHMKSKAFNNLSDLDKGMVRRLEGGLRSMRSEAAEMILYRNGVDAAEYAMLNNRFSKLKDLEDLGELSYNDFRTFHTDFNNDKVNEKVSKIKNLLREAEGIPEDLLEESVLLEELQEQLQLPAAYLGLWEEQNGGTANWGPSTLFRASTAFKGTKAAAKGLPIPGVVGIAGAISATFPHVASSVASMAGKALAEDGIINKVAQGAVRLPRNLAVAVINPKPYIWAATKVGLDRRLVEAATKRDSEAVKEVMGLLMEHPETSHFFEQGEGMLDENGNHVFTSEAARQSALQANKGTRSTRQRMVRQQMIEQGIIPPPEEPEPPMQLNYQFRPRDSKGRKL